MTEKPIIEPPALVSAYFKDTTLCDDAGKAAMENLCLEHNCIAGFDFDTKWNSWVWHTVLLPDMTVLTKPLLAEKYKIPRVEKGRVYFIKSENGLVKIGFTQRALVSRLAELQYQSPVPLFLLGSIPAVHDDEQALHNRFASSHSHGEWFMMTDEVAEFIRVSLESEK